MTITQIETALVAYMAAKLTADATLAGIAYDVLADNNAGTLNKDRPLVVLRAGSVNREIPNLLDVEVEVALLTPVDMAAFGMGEHGKLEAAIAKAWDKVQTPTAAANLSTAITAAATGWHGADFFSQGWQPGREDTNLAPILQVKVGVARDGV
jgi:hypothetical protein